MTPSDTSPAPPLKMRDLCDATGLNRQAIHFYIQQGLLPPGEKTGRNTATYTAAHLERLQLIRRLQHERFLPLEVIKDLLSAREDRYSDAQRAFLRRLRARLPGEVLGEVSGEEVEAEGLLDAEDLHDLHRLGLARLRADAEDVAPLVERTLPALNELLARLHDARLRAALDQL
ncbi:MAG: MerR family transcriptional regulator [Deltaproteobacteria bacterium]|nr:MerR family transcriptional regulator [Deltaproteobacteria bacterium]